MHNIFKAKNYLPLLLILFIGLSLGCNRVKDVIEPHTELIFPIEDGKFGTYLVIDTTFTTQSVVSDIFYRKEAVGGMEEDLLGREVYRLETYRSEEQFGTNFQFEFDRVWTEFKDDKYAERIVENVRTLLLKFPVSQGVEWNANLFNAMGTQRFKYQNIDTTVVVDNVSYENCVFVVEKADTSGFINNKFAYSIYAPNIGKIKSYDKTMVFDGAGGGFNPDKSFIHIETIVDHN